jgi:exopolyphosphatase/guanosine-5'-triphosphate,3'-diphosphate pyrophosphatase
VNPLSSPPRRAAVIAVGSNSTRMMTANLDRGLSLPFRLREETRLFLALDKENALSLAAVAKLLHTIAYQKRSAAEAGAQTVHLIATSAVRDAAQSEQLRRMIREHTGLDMNILSGQQEAAWSFLGAALPFGEGELGVIDIGGGSTEIALGNRDSLHTALSLQLGASRLYAQRPIDDPSGIAPALSLAGRVMDEAHTKLNQQAGRWLLVGGTGAALAGLLKGRLMPADQASDEPFSREQAEATLQRLAGLSPQQRAQLPGMTLGREHILPTGLAILCALMARLDITHMAVTARNNCDGFLYALARSNGFPGEE